MDELGDSTRKVPTELRRRADELCDEYEDLLADGVLPEIEGFLARIDAAGREHLLDELLGLTDEHLQRNSVGDPAYVIAARNPGLKSEVESYYTRRSDVQETVQFEGPSPAPKTPLITPRRRRSRGLHIRCPHCSNHVELVGDAALDSVDCTVCGSNFSLINRAQETRMAEALQHIDRFEVVARLGVGGFGTVWKARDTELDRAVAIKIPRYGQLTEEEQEQFFREARSVAQLRHRYIVPVHEVGREGDAVFIVSELVRGVSLADRLTGNPLTPREAAELCQKVAVALEHAHSRGVVHRDLKPSNIMIDEEGEPNLMDFGLAKREAEEVAMTIDGQIIGTPAYMSPEQAQGRSAWADRRTDVYSLGVMLFEMLTGELPFRGNAQMQVHLRSTEDAPNVRSLNRHIALDLATICAKCLEREPGRRYEFAKDLADDIGRYLNREPIHARPLSPIGRLARWVERRPLQAALAALVAFLAVAGPAAAVVINGQKRDLARSDSEKAGLLLAREASAREDAEKIKQLTDENRRLVGQSDPWSLWPPRPEMPPYRQQLTSLGSAIESSPASGEERPLSDAKRHLAMAAVHQGQSGGMANAIKSLESAERALEEALEQAPEDPRVLLALADCCERLALVQSDPPDRAAELLERVSDIREKVAKLPGWGVYAKSQLVDTSLRRAMSAGKAAGNMVVNALELTDELASAWPTSAEEQYDLASMLAGRTPWLSLPPLESSRSATPRP